MENKKSNKRKGYGAQNAEELKYRRKLFKINSKERGATESSSCLLNVAGPREKYIRWKKEVPIRAKSRNILSSKIEVAEKRVKPDFISGRTKSKKKSSSSIIKKNSDVDSNTSSEMSKCNESIFEFKSKTVEIGHNTIDDDNSGSHDEFNNSQPFPVSNRSYEAKTTNYNSIHSYLNSTDSVSTDSPSNHSLEITKKKRSSKSVRSHDDNSSNLTDFSNAPIKDLNQKNWKNSCRDLNFKSRGKRLGLESERESHFKTKDSLRSNIEELHTQNAHTPHSNDDEVNIQSEDDDSEFWLARRQTTHKNNEGRKILFDESPNSTISCCKSENQTAVKTKSLLYVSHDKQITKTVHQKSSPKLDRRSDQNSLTSKDLTESAYQSELEIDVEQLLTCFKKISDEIDVNINSKGELLTTEPMERVFIDNKQSMINEFQRLVKAKKRIIDNHDSSQIYFNSCFEKAAEIWGLEKLKEMFVRCFKTMLHHEVSLDAAFSFSKCMEFFTEIKRHNLCDCNLGSIYQGGISSCPKTMMMIIYDVDVIVCTLKTLQVCIKSLSKENMIVINRHTIDASLYSINISLAHLYSLDTKQFTDLLTDKNQRNISEIWKYFTNVIRNVHKMPTYASLEIILRIILRVWRRLLNFVTSIDEKQSVDRGELFFVEKLTRPLHAIFQNNLPSNKPPTRLRDNLELHEKIEKNGLKTDNNIEFSSTTHWIRQCCSEIQAYMTTTISSFRCNGIYIPSQDEEIGTRLAYGKIAWVDINISTISFSVDIDIESPYCRSGLGEIELFIPDRFEIHFFFNDLMKVTYSHHDCAVTFLVTMSAYDNSGVSILESNNHDALSIQNSVSLVPLHSQNKVTDSQKILLETKKVKIFVKRSMFRSFVDKLLSRGIIISAEDEPDEMNSTESFKCISTKNQYKSRHTFEKRNTQKTNQIELNTKYGLDNPSRIISAIQKDKTTEKNESDDNSLINKIHNRECIGPECLESNVDNTGDPRNDKKRDENSHSGMCEIFSELISSQIVTPAKASRCEEASEKYPHSAQKRDHYRDYKHKDDSPFSTTGNADASNSLTRMALDTSTAKITPARTATQHACINKYENQEHVEFSSNSFQLNPQRSFMGTISALLCATNLMDENCNLNQSCQFMDLLEADNNEGANLAQTIFKIDETLIRAVDAIKELHNRVKQLETFSVAHNLRESFSWVDYTFHITSNGSKTWDNRKKSAENKIAQELLAAIGRK